MTGVGDCYEALGFRQVQIELYRMPIGEWECIEMELDIQCIPNSPVQPEENGETIRQEAVSLLRGIFRALSLAAG